MKKLEVCLYILIHKNLYNKIYIKFSFSSPQRNQDTKSRKCSFSLSFLMCRFIVSLTLCPLGLNVLSLSGLCRCVSVPVQCTTRVPRATARVYQDRARGRWPTARGRRPRELGRRPKASVVSLEHVADSLEHVARHKARGRWPRASGRQ